MDDGPCRLARLLLILVVSCSLLAACGSDGDESNDTSDTASDTQDTSPEVTSDADDAVQTDTDVQQFQVLNCTDVLSAMERSFELEKPTEGTQIHAHVDFDGQTVWVAYSLPDPSGGFDSWVQRYNCNGTPAAAPMRIHPETDLNEIDPAVVVTGNELFFTWQRDNGTGMDNLEILHSRADLEGNILYEPTVLETTRDGMPNSGNEASVRASALPDGKAAIAGLRADANGLRFQVFAQRVNTDGSLDGEAIEPGVEMDDADAQPPIATNDNGDILLGWVRAFVMDMETGPDMPRFVEIANGAASPTAAPTTPISGVEQGGTVTFAYGPSNTWVAISVNNDILIADLNDPDNQITVGRAGAVEHSPTIVPTANGLALVFYRVRSGFTNDVLVQPLTTSNGLATAGGEVELTPFSGAGPYGSTAVHIADDVIFTAWAEGENPDFTIRARFLDLGVSFQ